MFLRFTKGQFDSNKTRLYRKCVFLGDAVVMESGDKIIGVAKLHNEDEKTIDYDVIVATQCNTMTAAQIARYIKDMIGKSNKFALNPSTKRRKYYVEEINAEVLPIKAQIKFYAN